MENTSITQIQKRLDKANADWYRAKDDWCKADAARDKAIADWYKADAARDKAIGQ